MLQDTFFLSEALESIDDACDDLHEATTCTPRLELMNLNLRVHIGNQKKVYAQEITVIDSTDYLNPILY